MDSESVSFHHHGDEFTIINWNIYSNEIRIPSELKWNYTLTIPNGTIIFRAKSLQEIRRKSITSLFREKLDRTRLVRKYFFSNYPEWISQRYPARVTKRPAPPAISDVPFKWGRHKFDKHETRSDRRRSKSEIAGSGGRLWRLVMHPERNSTVCLVGSLRFRCCITTIPSVAGAGEELHPLNPRRQQPRLLSALQPAARAGRIHIERARLFA